VACCFLASLEFPERLKRLPNAENLLFLTVSGATGAWPRQILGGGSGFDLGGGMDPTLALGFCRYSWRVGESSACPSVLVLSPPKSESDPMDGGRRNGSNDVLFRASVPSLVDTDVGVSVRAMGGGGFASVGITAWATGPGRGNGCSGPFFLPRSAENLF
jgi:hypothetical protein